jgi:hypothetical protein
MSPSPRLRPITALPVLAALAAVMLAACGSTGGSPVLPVPNSGSDAQLDTAPGSLAPWSAAVACARRNGMPGLPDPVIGADRRVTLPGLRRIPEPTRAVQSACAAQIRAVQSNSSTHPLESASDIRALLRVAGCMRTHGYPHWPDPNVRGEFQVSSADAGTPIRLGRAVATCGPLFPASGWHLVVTPSGQ